MIPNNDHHSSWSSALHQDEEGRVQGTAESGILILPFTEHMISSHQTHQLHRLKEQCCELVKFSKDTFWINSTASPSCLFEEYALNIFHYYCQDKADDPAGSGAEWWVQVKYDDIDKEAPDATEITIETNSNRSNGIDLHYDKDEEIGELFGIGIFPQISTVTYLSSREHDIPTLIVDNLTSSPVGSPIKHAYISEPIFGKHISFDGRYLHGAPVQLKNLFMKSLERNPAEPRVTFLVNIWLNYHPVKVQPIPQSILKLINTPSYIPITSFDLQSCDDIKTIKVNPADVNDDDDVGEWYKIPFISNKSSWGKDEDETGLYLKLWLPYRISSFISKSSKSPTKKKDTAKVDRDGGGTEVHTTSWMLEYTKTSCASLEYETDEEFIEDMEEGMDL